MASALLAATASEALPRPGGGGIPSRSPAGRRLLSAARRLENEGDNGNGNGNGNGDDYSFVSAFSLKFQGCHQISQWNAASGGGDGDGDSARVRSKRLVRFRLCPTGSCDGGSGSDGCSSSSSVPSASSSATATGGYGDYIVDLGTFVAAYWEGVGEGNTGAAGVEEDLEGAA